MVRRLEFLAGKLEPPSQRIAMVARTVLLDRLAAWRECTLTLIVSPAGFGKTTLLTQWWEQLQTDTQQITAWLSLEEDDVEPISLVAHLILSLQRAGLDVGELRTVAEHGLLETSAQATLLSLISRIIAAGKPVVLILDDYQRAQSRQTDEIVETLLRLGSRNLHLVVSSRDRPSIQVATLCARNLVHMLTATDLILSNSESATMFQGLVKSEEHSALYARTEGWAVVSQLMRIWIQRHADREPPILEFIGRNDEIADYLSEQLLQDLPAELQGLLLDAAILDHFCAELIDAVRSMGDSAALLDRLTHLDAVLIPLDRERKWLRFHTLFGDFLRHRLQMADPARVRVLHLRASGWLVRNGNLLDAVRHALRGEDIGLAVAIIDRAGSWQLIMTHGIGFVTNLLALFPPATLEQQPLLLALHAYLDLKHGDWSAAGRRLATIRKQHHGLATSELRAYTIVRVLFEHYLDEERNREQLRQLEEFNTTLDPDDYITLGTSQAICADCAIAIADLATAERYSRESLQNMRNADCVVGTTYCLFHLATTHYYKGNWRAAEDLLLESLGLAEANLGKDTLLKAVADCLLARLLFDRNELAAADALIEASLGVIERQDGWFYILLLAYETMVRIAFAERGHQAGLTALRRARKYAEEWNLPELAHLLDAWQLEHEVHTPAARLAYDDGTQTQETTVADHRSWHWRARFAWAVAHVRQALEYGHFSRAIQLVRGELELCELQSRRPHAAVLDALIALALKGQGQSGLAIQHFSRTLEFAEATGALRLFFDLGPAVQCLIDDALNDEKVLPPESAQRTFLKRVQRELSVVATSGQHQISTRQSDVLRELCRGRSNKEIGRHLGLSENTVKFHLRHIYRKLNVKSRVAALSAARRLSLQFETD